MPKVKGSKYYAVRKGREGPKIYHTWEETKKNVARYPGAVHKSFTVFTEAEKWLASDANAQKTDAGNLTSRIPSTSSTLPQNSSAGLAETKARWPATATSSPGPSKTIEQSEIDPAHSVPSISSESISLSKEQEAVLRMVKQGQSVFFTGSAGTGKSVLLREIIKQCRSRDGSGDKSLAITASTGIASVNIGGVTLHSWAGIGLGKEDVKKIFFKLRGSENVVARWRCVRTLIIDEISMIDGALFDKLEELARMFRNNQAPFGGIQLVLSGDFCQLPPVPDQKNGVSIPATFAFDAKSWKSCVGEPITLTRVFRQKDQAFVDMLNSMRFGRMDPKTIEKFQKLSRPVIYSDGIEPTDLFPKRSEVDAANLSRLNRLEDPCHEYNADDRPGFDDNDRPVTVQRMETLLQRLVAPKTIRLKVGAQVMLVKNLIQGELVNGSVGKVVGFSNTRDALQQGAELARTKKGSGSADNSENEVDEIPLHILQGQGVWPIVEFRSRRYLCVPASFEVNNAEGKVEASREQVPLILAWALSIHKSQGQTLERVRVNLGQIFEKGQAYVALSRATSMDTLQILHFDPAKVMAHPRVLTWMGQNKRGEVNDTNDVDDELEFWDGF